MTTNGRTQNRNGTKPDDPLGAFKNLGKTIVEDFNAALDQAIEKSTVIREAEAKFGNSGSPGIEIRHDQGLLHRENPEDRKRADALKANRDRGYLTADQLKLLGGFAAKGQEFVLDVVEHLTEDVHNRPPEVQPVAETLTNASVKIIAAAYVESLKFLAERGTQEIDQATKPGQRQQ